MTGLLGDVGEAAVLAFCDRVLDGCRVVADRSWPHRQAVVLEIADGAGRGWIVKHSRDPVHHRNEVRAYREWVGALGGLAPAMVAHDDALRVVLLSLEPGTVGTGAGADAHAQAGALVRRLHDAAPPTPAPDLGAVLAGRIEAAVAAGPGLFAAADVRLARRRVAALRGFPPPYRVPTHQDNQPRNWLVDRSGTVRLIDFGLSDRDVWVRDLVRLEFWDWADDPTGRDAFLAGYGRALSDADRAALAALGAVTALRTVLWARDHGDPWFAERGRRALEILRTEDR
jgi:hypothetical protein